VQARSPADDRAAIAADRVSGGGPADVDRSRAGADAGVVEHRVVARSGSDLMHARGARDRHRPVPAGVRNGRRWLAGGPARIRWPTSGVGQA
jgi:hypothetical protein